MRYDFSCPRCKTKLEVVMRMAEAGTKKILCPKCNTTMRRDFSGIRVGKGRKQYSRPIVSNSLAVSIDQIEEHKRMFPNIPITSEGQPVFDNYADHEAYLKECNVEKRPGKPRKGKRVQSPTPRNAAD